MLKVIAVAAALVLAPAVAFAMDCCGKDCTCCDDMPAAQAPAK